jgi:hypothetical protein
MGLQTHVSIWVWKARVVIGMGPPWPDLPEPVAVSMWVYPRYNGYGFPINKMVGSCQPTGTFITITDYTCVRLIRW